jgi:hypothetical protein
MTTGTATCADQIDVGGPPKISGDEYRLWGLPLLIGGIVPGSFALD